MHTEEVFCYSFGFNHVFLGPMTPYTPFNIANIHNIDLIPAIPLNIIWILLISMNSFYPP